MAVIITNIDMPNHCYECPFRITDDEFVGHYYCKLQLITKKRIINCTSAYKSEVTRIKYDKINCPLKEVEE